MNMLTAEQVRDATMSAHRLGSSMDNTGMTNTHLIIRDDCWQAIADELNATLENECTKCLKDTDVDEVYTEKIKPRLIKGTPTEDIRRWSVLAHSVMELTGPSTFGVDGNVSLWLHENSLTQLLDMCDIVDEQFTKLENEMCEPK